MDNLTPEQRKKNMRSIRNKDSKSECLLRRALWAKGYRYRKNYKKLIGVPDIVFTSKRLVIFCDGEFWHGYYYQTDNDVAATNTDYWNKKIKKNMERDIKVTQQLEAEGWTVIRFWSKEILKDLESCVLKIEIAIMQLDKLILKDK